MRSTNNGNTWEQLTNLPYAYYETAVGDGNLLYASPTFGGWYTSPETDGKNWTKYNGTVPSVGAYMMRYDAVNGIMYAACKNAGLWALKTGVATGTAGGTVRADKVKPMVSRKISGHGSLLVPNPALNGFVNIRGIRIR